MTSVPTTTWETAMPHIDELLGVATIATAGLLAAIAFQPLPPSGFAAGADRVSQRDVALVINPAGERMSTLRCDTGV